MTARFNRPRGRPRQLEMQNEGFNALQDGCNLERNFGHGKESLDSVLLVCNFSTFTARAACRLQVKAWQAARKKWADVRIFFEVLRIFLCTMLFRSWDEPMGQMASGKRIPLDGPKRSVSLNLAGTSVVRATPQDHRIHALLNPGNQRKC